MGGEPIEFFAYLEEDLFSDDSPDHVVRDRIFFPQAPEAGGIKIELGSY